MGGFGWGSGLRLLGGLVAISGLAARVAAEDAAGSASRPAATTAGGDPQIVAINPISGPAAGGTSVSIYGLDFAAGSTVTIGEVPATGLSLVGAAQIDATTPALTPGSLNDVVVAVPGQAEVTLDGAWFARFSDVPPTHPFARAIEKLRRAEITTGCGGGNYCPGDPVTRAQMAVFILRGKHGSSYHPPPATGTVFDDVPKTALFADWIEQFASEGITTGCGVKMYCPNQQVTRGEMAVFLLRARHGSAHQPPPPIGFFGDVTTTTPFAKWIEELAGETITSGCGPGLYCPTGPATRGEMAVFLTKAFAASVQEEIAFDLDAGDIDYETSLLYRFYALFRDDRLPVKYQAAPTSAEDSELFDEARAAFPDLSPQGQAEIGPFLTRPDDPSNPFGPAASPVAAGSVGVAAATATGNQCPTPWVDSSNASSHFRIHLCPTGDAAADQSLRSSVNTLADGLWTPMTMAPPAGMGEPIADCFTPQGSSSEVCLGGDAKIDVYLLATKQCRSRNGSCRPIPGDAVAMAVSSPPSVGRGSSGYMLLEKSRALDPSAIKSDFAHEFFHVLQFRHNIFYAYEITVGNKKKVYNNWFVEASAAWAEWNYVPETAADEVHFRFPLNFQHSRQSLMTNIPKIHPYASYIWAFFAQQEKGGPRPVFQAWVAAESSADSTGLTDAVDQQLSFETHFRDFAVRNWNQDLPGQPIPVLYKDLPPSSGGEVPFPEGSPPFVNVVHVGPTSPKQKPKFRINALAAQYDQINVESTVKKVVLRFKGLPAGIDVDLLVKTIPEHWERRRVNKADGAAFCRDKADQKVERIIVILSNHEKKKGTFRAGNYEVEKRASCCTELGEAIGMTANVSFSYSHSGDVYGNHITASQTASLTAHLKPVLPPGIDTITFEATPINGTASVHDRQTFEDGDMVALDGNGPPQPGSGISLTIDLTKCTCDFVAGAYINATATPPGSVGLTGVGAAGGLAIDVANYVDQITGSGNFPAHAGGTSNAESAYIPAGLGILFFIDPANENSGGSAGVSWSFKAEMPP